MITLSVKSPRGQRFLDNYYRAYRTTLDECYANPSSAKCAAIAMCQEWCAKENGVRFRIISYNAMTFTCAWLTDDGLRVETAYNSYLVRGEK